jgi:plasmid stabilization system protein ParE
VSSSTRKIIFSENARSEFESACAWYEDQRKGLGAQFVLYIEAKLEMIRKSPELFPLVYSNYRKATLKRFPYLIFFEIVDENIHLLAVFHTSRKPKYS